MRNPFELVTASKLTATEAVDLWCDDQRLARVWGKENCFINGHRGTGKSMLFRVLQYDCQKLLFPAKEPDFLSVYFSVRDSELMTEELDFFQQDSQKSILSESHFALLILKQLFILLQVNPTLIPTEAHGKFHEMLQNRLDAAFQFSSPSVPKLDASADGLCASLLQVIETERLRIIHYICLRLYEHSSFDGPLFLFDTLLGPVADFLHREAKKTVYVLIDDGDDLPESHTIVLNTWIARRHTALVFKVSTMFGYKTYHTRARSAIQHPHDFTQYDIATRYLSDYSEDYIELLKNITEKRLQATGINVKPEDYFPEDRDQRFALSELEASLVEEYKDRYKGRSPRMVRDYVYRHLTSEYLKRSLRPSRAMHNFTYSGFNTIATLSSGMVRDFIICAQRMFDNASRISTDVQLIPSNIQSDVVKQHADFVLEEVSNHKQKRSVGSTREDWVSIKRLIEGLGNVFKAKMLSDDSERRVFSFAFQDEPTPDIERLLDFAISEGYLMKGFISRKEGTGRRILYVLTRRLAPAFSLDVTSYAGYLSLRCDRIRRLMEYGPEEVSLSQAEQLTLFQDTEFIGSVPEDEPTNKAEWVFISPEEAGQ